MKTSKKISLKFTVFTILAIFLFGLFANIVFFRHWYSGGMNFLERSSLENIHIKRILGRERGPMMDKFPLRSEEAKIILENKCWKNISHLDGHYFLFIQKKNILVLTDITHAVDAQINLLRISLYLLLIFALLAYFLSLFFIKTSLKRLNELVTFAQNLHLDSLDKRIILDGPDDDEIKILAETLNFSLSQLYKQAFALKDFVAHASHELKTPLMAMSSELDLAIKSKDLSSLKKIKYYLKSMNSLIEQLLLITKLEGDGKLKIKDEKIKTVVFAIVEMLEKKYEDKKLVWELDLENVSVKCHLSSFEMIVQNLLDNAAKYSKKGGKIKIILDENSFFVKDEGVGIEKRHLKHIWDRFWQEDVARTDKKSFGLGLYLVKKLVDLHGWNIDVESVKEKGAVFIVEFMH